MLFDRTQPFDFSLLPFGEHSRTLPVPNFLKFLKQETVEVNIPLKKIVKKFAIKKPHRPNKKELQRTNMNFGRWDKDEHKRFLEAMKMYGNTWRLVKEHVGTRTEYQIRSHAQKHYKKMLNKEIERLKQDSNPPLFAVIRGYYCTNTVP